MKQFENTSNSSVPDIRYNTALFPTSQESPACPSERLVLTSKYSYLSKGRSRTDTLKVKIMQIFFI